MLFFSLVSRMFTYHIQLEEKNSIANHLHAKFLLWELIIDGQHNDYRVEEEANVRYNTPHGDD